MQPIRTFAGTQHTILEEKAYQYLYKYPRVAIQWLNRSTLCPHIGYIGNKIELVHAMYPDFFHPGSRIQQQQQEEGRKEINCVTIFCSDK